MGEKTLNFKYSEDFSIDTEKEPWVREGTRLGIFGAPGSTKSYTAAAFIIEPFLEQKGTIVIFQPRAEWHTLKNKYPDVQVIGGPYNQDAPFVASHPKLYAEAVVNEGISMIFYTEEADDEEKKVNFVENFLKHVMQLQEVKHRPILVVLEEAHEYAPMNAKGHVAPPWVFNRMVKRCMDLYSGGRKLNIVPLAITQRPQLLHFSIRQLCNLSLYGQFAPQDINYIDKECLSHYRKEGLKLNAGDLKVLDPGNFLVIHHGEAGYKQRTVERITPHGADTPSLEFIPDSSDEVKTAVSSLGESLKKLLEQQAEEESEIKKLKRDNRTLETKNAEQAEKLKFGVNLQELMKGGQADPKLIQDNERLTAELVSTKKDLENSRTDCKNVQEVCSQLTDDINALSKRLPELQRYEKYAEAVDLIREALNIPTLEHRISELLSDIDTIKKGSPTAQPQKGIPAQPPKGKLVEGTLIVEKTDTELQVLVHRDKVKEDESTLKGQIAIMISEGYMKKWRSARSIGRDLQRLGYNVTEHSKSIITELKWFTQQRILLHDDKQGWMVKDQSRIIVKEI